jgi:YaiO family outer membrane protein
VALFVFLAATVRADDDDILTRARALATSQQRGKALAMLEDYLTQHPGDTDARLLYGLVLSWEGQYDHARLALQNVLEAHPTYADAVLALTNVELWSGNPDQAEQVTRRFLEAEPNHLEVMKARARVLDKLKRVREAIGLLNSVLQQDPHNSEAADLRRAMKDEDRSWMSGATYNFIGYSDHSSSWQEESFNLRRGVYAGSLGFRFSRAQRWGESGTLSEVDWYPSLGRGTYAYVNAGYSPEHTLYPTYRGAVEIFRNLGRGFESSAGVNRLIFSTAHVTFFTGSLGRYHKSWYGSVRTYVTPGGDGTSFSVHFLGRRYFGDSQRYIGCRYGYGTSPFGVRSTNEIGILNSHSSNCEVNWTLANRVYFSVNSGVGREDRIERVGVFTYQYGLTFYFRF